MTQTNLFHNDILDTFPVRRRERLLSIGKWVEFEVDDDLTFSSRLSDFAYFPADCIIQLVNEFADGSGSEILMIGREGFCGSSLFPAVEESGTRTIVIRTGRAFRIPGPALVEEFNEDDTSRWLILQANHQSFKQAAGTGACRACLRLEQMLCRWLVMFSDRSGTPEIKTTQERIARALGVRREGVSQAMSCLRERGLLQYRRSCISLLDLEGLRFAHLNEYLVPHQSAA